jgi:plasmid stabilization system protein ParE
MKGFLLHRLAKADLREAVGYYRKESPELANEFLVEVERVIERLVAHPQSAPRAGSHHRMARITRFHYNLLYRVEDDHIFVVAVFHQRRRPGFGLDRR